jgi:hypothetical protein
MVTAKLVSYRQLILTLLCHKYKIGLEASGRCEVRGPESEVEGGSGRSDAENSFHAELRGGAEPAEKNENSMPFFLSELCASAVLCVKRLLVFGSEIRRVGPRNYRLQGRTGITSRGNSRPAEAGVWRAGRDEADRTLAFCMLASVDGL